MKQRYTVGLGLFSSAVLIVIILLSVDVGRVGEAFTAADYRYLLPAFALLIVGMFTRAVRWRSLLNDQIPLRHAFSILNIVYLLNGALPFRLGELARIFLATRTATPIPAITTLSSVLVERLFDLLAVVAMLGFVLVVSPVPGYVVSAGVVLGLGAIGAIIMLMVFAHKPALGHAVLRIAERLMPFLKKWDLHLQVTRFAEGLLPLTSWRRALFAVLWTAVSWIFSVAAGYVLLMAFFPSPTWTATLFFIVMASLAFSVPYVPGAVGPYEAGVVVALSLTGFGEPEGTAVAFAIVLHIVNTAVYVLLGVLGLLHQGVSLGQVMQGARSMNKTSTSVMVGFD